MAKLRLSQFNVIKTLGESTWVYNTLTSAFIKIPAPVWSSVATSDDQQLVAALERQGILVEDNETELSKYRYIYYNKMFSSKMLSVTIAPTMHCNFGCPYCFEGVHKVMPAMNKDVEDALVNYLKEQSKSKEIAINWFGGEPLLAFDVINSVCSRLEAAGVEFVSSMVTNGSLLTEKTARQLSPLHLTHLQITLDGIAATHDRRRCYKNGKPSFADIMSNIRGLMSLTDISLAIQVGVDNTNPTAYEDVYEYMQMEFPDEMQSGRIVIGCNNIQNRTGFDKSGVCMTDRQLFEKGAKAVADGKYKELMTSMPGKSLPCMYRCTNQPVIDPEGNVYRCLEHLGRKELSVGSIISGKVSFGRVAGMAFEGDPFDDEECRRCAVLPVCGGGCPNDIVACKDRKHKNYCSIYKNYLADMLPVLYDRIKLSK